MPKKLLILATALLALPSCSGIRQPGTGDLAVRLIWRGHSDLDLYVGDPQGSCIYFAARRSPSNGILDIDCNGTPDQMCKQPIENVYWPATLAPAGTYTLAVHAHALLPAESPLHFEVQLLRGQQIVWRQSGVIVSQAQTFGPLEFRYPDRMTPKLDTKSRPANWCGARAL